MSKTTRSLLIAVTAVAPIGFVAAAASAAAEPTPVPSPADSEKISGTITSIDTAASSFVVTDDAEATHTVKAGDHTRYQLNGKASTRDEVVSTGATVEVKMAEDGTASVVNRITE